MELRYQPPYDWDSMLGFFQARAIAGVESVEYNGYRRNIGIDGLTGSIQVAHVPERQSLCVTIDFPRADSIPEIVTRVRRTFDTEADIATIGAHLSADPHLARLVAQRPGLRVPGAWDAFELAVRAILGQQVSVAAARKLAGQLVARYGEPVPGGFVFPEARRLVRAESIELGMPGARRLALKALAAAVVEDPKLTVSRLHQIRGIGEWTVQYIALRALRDPDAFPAADVGLLRGAEVMDGTRPTVRQLLARAEHWRPWRGYAAQHLWAAAAAFKTGT